MILLFLKILFCVAFNISSWWVGDMKNSIFQIEQLNWDIYTHIHYGSPLLGERGKVHCNKTDHNLKKLVNIAHNNGVKVMWGGGGMPLDDFLWDPTKNI